MRRGRRGIRDRWRTAIYAAVDLSHAARVGLLLMGERATDGGVISVPREHLAAVLGVAPRRITAYVKRLSITAT